MTMIYHGTPISPVAALRALGARAFCVSFYRPDDAARCEAVAPHLMYDNGAYSFYTAARRAGLDTSHAGDWSSYYAWLEPRLPHPGRWAVIPDVIDGGPDVQDQLLAQWPHGERGAPVWHTDEPLDRLLALVDRWPRVCFGSAGAHWKIGGALWTARMDEAWSTLERLPVRPVVHMLRGTGVAHRYPFASADSSGLAQNGHRYRQPLFAGTPDEWTGLVAFADRLEKRAASGLHQTQSSSINGDRGRFATTPGPLTLVEGALVPHLQTQPHGSNT